MIPEQTPGSASGMPATRGMPRSQPQEEAKTEEAKRESEPSEESTNQQEMTEYEALSRLAPRPKKENAAHTRVPLAGRRQQPPRRPGNSTLTTVRQPQQSRSGGHRVFPQYLQLELGAVPETA